MSKLKLDKRGCGKLLQSGDCIVERWGVVLCDACDLKHPAPMLAVYGMGHLRDGVTIRCGQLAREAKEEASNDRRA